MAADGINVNLRHTKVPRGWFPFANPQRRQGAALTGSVGWRTRFIDMSL